MLTEPPSPALDLLVVGGLTIDRFADGSIAAGGSVLHIARAASRRGIRLGVVTAAGPEEAATAGLGEMRRIAQRVDVAPDLTTATFRHQETPDGRRLWLEQGGGPVTPRSVADAQLTAKAVLYAPVFDELGVDAIRAQGDFQPRGAILQGWLRVTAGAGEVTHVPLARLDRQLLQALMGLDVVIASREDLAAEATSPFDQLTALRAALGPGPVLIVTGGGDGLWMDVSVTHVDHHLREHLPVPKRLDDVPTVGAGDILAAFLTMRANDPAGGWLAHAERAMRVVAEELQARQGR